jgi:CrcB protein
MTVEPLLVGMGGALGAVGRYAVGRALGDWRFPLPTLVVNVAGSFVFGLLVASGAGERAVALFGVGFCGAFTTYATFSVDTARLWRRSRPVALAYAVGTLVACLLAVALATGLVAVAG